MTKAESARSEVTVRRATARDVEQIATNIQSVADEGGYIWTEKVTGEWKQFLRKTLIKDKGCLVIVAEVGRGRGKWLVGDLTIRGTARR